MIDFSNCETLMNRYGGSERKLTMVYKDAIYLVKFPDPVREIKNPLSYMNNQFSEYVGCHIFQNLGIKAQETLLGTYTSNDKTRIVVACKDFTDENSKLIEFSKLANSTINSNEKFGTIIEDVYSIIYKNDILTNKEAIIRQFWDVFVVDALIGNKDRHLDNWGFLSRGNKYEFAPIYDCGSSLQPLLDENNMKKMLDNYGLLKSSAYTIRSAYKMNNRTILYSDIFKCPPNDLKDAIKRIAPKIDMEAIRDIINHTEGMSDVHRKFMFDTIEVRNVFIIQPALKRILKQEKSLNIKGRIASAKEKVDRSVSDETDVTKDIER